MAQRGARRSPSSRPRLVEADASLLPRTHDFVHRQLPRMLGLQMRSDEADAALEALERHARGDAGALDAPAGGNAVVAVKRAQQRGLAAAVTAVDQPPLAAVHRQRQPTEHRSLVEID